MKKKFKSKFITIPIIIINLILSIYLLLSIYKLDILPNKYLLIIIIGMLLINLITSILLSIKKIFTQILGIILSIIIITISIIGSTYIGETNTFLDNSFNNNIIVETSKYDLLVLKESEYKDITDIEGKTLGEYSLDEEVKTKLAEMVTPIVTEYEDVLELYQDLLDKKVEAMLIDKAYLSLIEDTHEDVYDKVKDIYSFSINKEIEEPTPEKAEKLDELRPINIFISGSDSREETIALRSRSDVNMIVTINPETNKILLTSIPRDYYLNVYGKNQPTKLSNVGIFGLDTTAKTVAEAFDIDIDYSIKVNFNAVEEVVDLVGGVDIYSDKSFNSSHIRGWRVKEGINHMDGKHALAYARERYAYKEGDRHRVKNQQQVLTAVLEKIMDDKTILLKYNDLLSSLSDFYRTDIPSELITMVVKNQLEKMTMWSIESQSVDGTGLMTKTFTAPKSKVYVMVPNQETVNQARKKIIAVMNEE